MTDDFTAPRFTDEEAARAHLESIRWPSGPICPHCGGTDRQSRLHGAAHRPGVIFCGECREQYTVTVGTVFERSKISLHKWVLATHLLCSSKKGMSSHQLHRTLGVTYKTAWFMTHRIREAMRPADFPAPFGEGGGSVEVDETFIGVDKDKPKPRKGPSQKNVVLSLVDRTTRQSRSMVISFDLKWRELLPVLDQYISHEARLLTDDAGHYKRARIYFAGHETVNHKADEYVRLSDRSVHTNTVEGFFSIFKRGMKGVYQHCGKQHLHRYLHEFDFRCSNRSRLGIEDAERANKALKGVSGKRLTYRRIDAQNPRVAPLFLREQFHGFEVLLDVLGLDQFFDCSVEQGSHDVAVISAQELSLSKRLDEFHLVQRNSVGLGNEGVSAIVGHRRSVCQMYAN